MSTLERYVKSFGDVNAKRSHKVLHRITKHSYFHGYLHMVGSPIEVLPGDTFKAKLSAFTRMSTPIVPFMDDIRQEYDAWFVPYRILNNKIKNFYGEAEDFGIARNIELPYIVSKQNNLNVMTPLRRGYFSTFSNLIKSESFVSMMDWIFDEGSQRDGNVKFNLLPLYGFLSIYNEHYRDENFQPRYMWNKDAEGLQNNAQVAYLSGVNLHHNSLAPQVCKDRDLVTTILPWQVKGTPLTINLTGTAPIFASGGGSDIPVITGDPNPDIATVQSNDQYYQMASGVKPIKFGLSDAPTKNKVLAMGVSTGPSGYLGLGRVSDSTDVSSTNDHNFVPINLYSSLNGAYADLANVTGISLSNLVYSLAYQNLMARQAKYGTRYKEYIKSMFNTTVPDATEDVPEYLGRMKFRINVNTVVQTTGFDASSNTELGSLGAYSASGDSKELFNKSFTEPGMVYIVTYTKHKRTYSSGCDRIYLKTDFLDFYQPPLAALYDVPFMRNHIWLTPENDVSIGWQEPWWDYNSLEDRCYGLMNPMTDTLGEIWTLAEKWSTSPAITGSFLMEDRAAIARVLATGINGPDYLLDVDLTIDTVRVMPVSSDLALRVM